ncbi:hypothetical protein DGG96_00765 [Legionella qingyii]|nr:hypothetical protein DGG96_00765 [Legionella qingyii]
MCDEQLQYAFEPQIRMSQDRWAKETVSDATALNYLAECLGFQLEIDEAYGDYSWFPRVSRVTKWIKDIMPTARFIK